MGSPGGYDSSRPAMNWSPISSAFFITFARPVWALAFGVITSACYYGYLPLCDGALSHWMWQPFVKLTYGAYLLHPVVIRMLAGNMTTYFHYSLSEVLLHALGHCAISFGAAIVMWCLVEKPCASLVAAAISKVREDRSAITSDKLQVRAGDNA